MHAYMYLICSLRPPNHSAAHARDLWEQNLNFSLHCEAKNVREWEEEVEDIFLVVHDD